MPNLIEMQPVGSANPDHTFVEVAEKFACPECGEWLEAQVRREIATGLASQIAPIAAIAPIEAWDCRGQLYFRQAAALPNRKLLWHSNSISLLDADTWDVHETLNYQPTPRETVAFSPDGSSYVIGRSNDAVVVDRATNRAWSLRREREIRLLNRA